MDSHCFDNLGREIHLGHHQQNSSRSFEISGCKQWRLQSFTSILSSIQVHYLLDPFWRFIVIFSKNHSIKNTHLWMGNLLFWYSGRVCSFSLFLFTVPLNPLLRFTAQGQLDVRSFQLHLQCLSGIYLVWSCYLELGSYLTHQWLFTILGTNGEHKNNMNNDNNESTEKWKALYSGFKLQHHEGSLHHFLPLVFYLWKCNLIWEAKFLLSFFFSTSTERYQSQFRYEKMSFSNFSTRLGERQVFSF